jgi:probable phosphoglycerate mutase
LERTRETAGFIGRALGVRVRTRQELLECDVGDWTGSRLRRITGTRAWKTVHAWPSGFRFPGGESFSEMATRAEGVVVRLAESHRGESIVVVSHADPIKAVVASAAGTPLDLFQRFVISPCSVSAILYSADGPHVLCVNSPGPPDEPELS